MVKDSTQRAMTSQTNATNYAMNAQNNITNMALAAAQNQFDMNMWNMNNAYNDPQAQFKRLVKSGMSMAAAAQAVQGFESQPVTSAELANQQAMQMQTPDMSGSKSGLELVRDILGNMQMGAEAMKSMTDAEMERPQILTELEGKQWATNLARQQFMENTQNFPYSNRYLKYQANAGKYLEEAARLANEDLKWKIKTAEQTFGWTDKLSNEELKKLIEETKSIVQQGELTEEKIKNEKLTSEQIKATTQGIKANTEQTKEQTENIKKQGKVIEEEVTAKKLENIFTRFGAPQDSAMKIAAMIASGELPNEMIDKVLQAAHAYINSGYSEFSGDEDTRRYLLYIFDQGMGESRKLGLYTAGAVKDAADDAGGLPKKKRTIKFNWNKMKWRGLYNE